MMGWKRCDHQEREGFNRDLEVLKGMEFHYFFIRQELGNTK